MRLFSEGFDLEMAVDECCCNAGGCCAHVAPADTPGPSVAPHHNQGWTLRPWQVGRWQLSCSGGPETDLSCVFPACRTGLWVSVYLEHMLNPCGPSRRCGIGRGGRQSWSSYAVAL